MVGRYAEEMRTPVVVLVAAIALTGCSNLPPLVSETRDPSLSQTTVAPRASSADPETTVTDEWGIVMELVPSDRSDFPCRQLTRSEIDLIDQMTRKDAVSGAQAVTISKGWGGGCALVGSRRGTPAEAVRDQRGAHQRGHPRVARLLPGRTSRIRGRTRGDPGRPRMHRGSVGLQQGKPSEQAFWIAFGGTGAWVLSALWVGMLLLRDRRGTPTGTGVGGGGR